MEIKIRTITNECTKFIHYFSDGETTCCCGKTNRPPFPPKFKEILEGKKIQCPHIEIYGKCHVKGCSFCHSLDFPEKECPHNNIESNMCEPYCRDCGSTLLSGVEILKGSVQNSHTLDKDTLQVKPFVSHGKITHPISECDTCEVCMRVKSEFEKAKKDGTLDKILSAPDTAQEKHLENCNFIKYGKGHGCNCKAFPAPDTAQEWEERFDEKFDMSVNRRTVDLVDSALRMGAHWDWTDIKDFIRSERISAQKEILMKVMENKKQDQEDGEEFVLVEDIQVVIDELEIKN